MYFANETECDCTNKMLAAHNCPLFSLAAPPYSLLLGIKNNLLVHLLYITALPALDSPSTHLYRVPSTTISHSMCFKRQEHFWGWRTLACTPPCALASAASGTPGCQHNPQHLVSEGRQPKQAAVLLFMPGTPKPPGKFCKLT